MKLYFLLVLISSSQAVFSEEQNEDLFTKFAENVQHLSKSVSGLLDGASAGLKRLIEFGQFAASFLDASIDEDCFISCPKGYVLAPKENHIRRYNGCGSMGFNIPRESLPVPCMVDCCNEHDVCYDTCLADKELCDKQFKKCLYASCKKKEKANFMDTLEYKKCSASAKMLYSATMLLGCKSYKDAQRGACACIKGDQFTNYKDDYSYNYYGKQKHRNEL